MRLEPAPRRYPLGVDSCGLWHCIFRGIAHILFLVLWLDGLEGVKETPTNPGGKPHDGRGRAGIGSRGVVMGVDFEWLEESLMTFSLCHGWTVVCVIFDERPARLPGLIATENLDGIPAL